MDAPHSAEKDTGALSLVEVALILSQHRRGDLITALDKAWVECSCEEIVPVPVRNLSVSWGEAQDAYEAHVAEQIVATTCPTPPDKSTP